MMAKFHDGKGDLVKNWVVEETEMKLGENE
jgi:hypothetical protein